MVHLRNLVSNEEQIFSNDCTLEQRHVDSFFDDRIWHLPYRLNSTRTFIQALANYLESASLLFLEPLINDGNS